MTVASTRLETSAEAQDSAITEAEQQFGTEGRRQIGHLSIIGVAAVSALVVISGPGKRQVHGALRPFAAAMAQTTKLAHGVASAATQAGPSVLREIVYGSMLGVFVGSFWKMHHVNSQRKVDEFYAALEKGEITVEAS